MFNQLTLIQSSNSSDTLTKFYKAYCLIHSPAPKYTQALKELNNIPPKYTTESVVFLKYLASYRLGKFEDIVNEYLSIKEKQSRSLKIFTAYSYEKLGLVKKAAQLFSELSIHEADNDLFKREFGRLNFLKDEQFRSVLSFQFASELNDSEENISNHAVSLIRTNKIKEGLFLLNKLADRDLSLDQVKLNVAYFMHKYNDPLALTVLEKYSNIPIVALMYAKELIKLNMTFKASTVINVNLSYNLTDELRACFNELLKITDKNNDVSPSASNKRSSDNNLISLKLIEMDQSENNNEEGKANLLNISENCGSSNSHEKPKEYSFDDRQDDESIGNLTKDIDFKSVAGSQNNLISSGLNFFERGEYSKAIEVFDSYGESMDDSTNRIYIECCEKMKDRNKAIKRLEFHLAQFGYSDDILYSIIQNSALIDDKVTITKHLSIFKERNPNSQNKDIVEVLLHHKNCRSEAAALIEQQSEKQVKMHLLAKLAILDGHYDKAISILDTLDNETSIKNDANLSKTYGRALARKGMIKEATRYYKYALKKNLHDYEAAIKIAEIYLKLGNLNGAEKYIDYIPEESSNLRVRFTLGRLSYRRKEFEKAKEYFEQCIVKDGDNVKVYHNLAMIALEMKNNEEARRMLEKSIKCDSLFFPTVYEYFRLLCIESNLKEAEKYVEQINCSIEENKELLADYIILLADKLKNVELATKLFETNNFEEDVECNIAFAIGSAFNESGKYDDSAKYFTKCQKLLEKSFLKATVFINCLIKLGKIDDAQELLSKFKNKQTFEEFMILKGKIEFHRGNYKAALKEGKALLEVSDQNEEAVVLTAATEYKLRNYDNAISVLNNFDQSSQRVYTLELLVSFEGGYSANVEDLEKKLNDKESIKLIKKGSFDVKLLV